MQWGKCPVLKWVVTLQQGESGKMPLLLFTEREGLAALGRGGGESEESVTGARARRQRLRGA